MSDLKAAIDQMIAIEGALGEATLAAQRDASRKAAVIEMRRRFAQCVIDVAAKIDGEPRLRADPALATEFRRRFSEMRSRVAVFQAKWPAVLLDRNDPEFERTAQALRSENRAFTLWARQLLARQPAAALEPV